MFLYIFLNVKISKILEKKMAYDLHIVIYMVLAFYHSRY